MMAEKIQKSTIEDDTYVNFTPFHPGTFPKPAKEEGCDWQNMIYGTERSDYWHFSEGDDENIGCFGYGYCRVAFKFLDWMPNGGYDWNFPSRPDWPQAGGNFFAHLDFDVPARDERAIIQCTPTVEISSADIFLAQGQGGMRVWVEAFAWQGDPDNRIDFAKSVFPIIQGPFTPHTALHHQVIGPTQLPFVVCADPEPFRVRIYFRAAMHVAFQGEAQFDLNAKIKNIYTNG